MYVHTCTHASNKAYTQEKLNNTTPLTEVLPTYKGDGKMLIFAF